MNISAKWLLLPALATSLLLLASVPGLGGLPFAAWIGLVPLFLAISRSSPRKAALAGFVTGVLYYGGLLSWILVVLGHYGNLPWWLSLPALFLLAAYMAVYPALFSAICSWGLRSSIPLPLLAPPLWVVLDYLRSQLFSGFPWQDLAYSQYQVAWVIQAADLTGHHGITFLLVAVNCVLFLLVAHLVSRRWTNHPTPRFPAMNAAAIVVVLLTVVSVYYYGGRRAGQIGAQIAAAPTIQVAVVQGNIEQDQKWTPAMQEKTVEVYTDLSRRVLREAGTENTLVIWPETALPFYPLSNPLFFEMIDTFVRRDRVWLFSGIPYYEPPAGPAGESDEGHYYNSALLVSPEGRIAGRYDKQHLVPFGEYMPLRRYLPLPRALVESVGDFTPGLRSEPLSCQNSRIGVLICFESIFPEIARNQVRQGATLLVNQTNDAWFGRSAAPEQHLSMAVFRAAETRRSLARAANTGISGFIDPLGRVSQPSQLFTPYTGVAQLPLLEEQTFFVTNGFWFVWLCLGVTTVSCLAGTGANRRRRKHSPSPTT